VLGYLQPGPEHHVTVLLVSETEVTLRGAVVAVAEGVVVVGAVVVVAGGVVLKVAVTFTAAFIVT
jgi:hypothetical protein